MNKKNIINSKITIRLWALSIALLLGISACTDDDEPVIIPEEEEEILVTDESGVTLTNTKDIVLGESGDDQVFEMTSTILTTSGRVEETTLNCCAMGAIGQPGNYHHTYQSIGGAVQGFDSNP